jgi:hypothetical protein
MILSRRTLLVTGYYLAALTLLPLLVYYVTLEREHNTVTVTPHIVAEQPDIFAIYWPGESGNYVRERSAGINFSAGESRPELIIGSFPSNHLLRIDPISQKGKVRLLGLTIKRFGVEYELSADDLAPLLTKSIGTTVQNTHSSLEINSASADPQLFFRDLALPLPPTHKIIFPILLFVFLFSLIIVAGKRILESPPKRLRTYHFICPLTFVLLCLVFDWPLEITILSSALLVLALQHAVVYLAVSRPKRPSLQQVVTLANAVWFLSLICVPLLFTLAKGSFTESIENQSRSLISEQEQTGFSGTAREIIKGIEDNLIRHFFFRDDLVELNANIKLFGMGFSPTSKAILGKNGMFFEGYGERRVEEDITGYFDNVTDYMGLIPFSTEELEAWRVCLEERYYWLRERGIDYIFVLAPSKAMIYPENLPDKIIKVKRSLNKPTRYEQLSRYLKLHSKVPFVDLSEPLLLAKRQGPSSRPLYYRTDFHWNYYGSFIAYRAIVKEIQRKYPAHLIDPASLQDFSIDVLPDWVHANFIHALGLDPFKHRNEPYFTLMPRPGSIHASISDFGTKGIDDNSLPEPVVNNYRGHRIPTSELNNPQGEIDTLFVIGDSFSEKYFGYFSAHAKKTVNFRTVYSFFTKPFKDYSPDLVIQEVLNMYLLHKPPGNPPEVAQARVAALARIALASKAQERNDKIN